LDGNRFGFAPHDLAIIAREGCDPRMEQALSHLLDDFYRQFRS
jgi:hypothetical protein